MSCISLRSSTLSRRLQKEEGGAVGYTRGNYIVLKAFESVNPEGLESLILHELFHVLSRVDATFRARMYTIIGFEMMPPVEYPESLRQRRITNPDAPQTDSYITVNVEDEPVDCMMVLYADKDYDGGDFFSYLNIGFLQLEGGDVKSVAHAKDGPIIHSMEDVKGFFEQVGNNTGYIIHPEEILADNFTFAILDKSDLKTPRIVDEMRTVLTGVEEK